MAAGKSKSEERGSRIATFHPPSSIVYPRCLAVLALLFALIHCALSFALDVPPLRGRVNDYADLMTPARAQALEQRFEQFENESGHQIAVLTIRSLEGEDIEGFSIRVAENWKIGKKGFDNGAILVIAQNDRKLRIEVGYGLEGVLPDAIASRIIREVIVARFRDGDFAGGVEAGAEAIMKAASGEPLPETARATKRRGALASPIVEVIPLLLLLGLYGLSALSWWGNPRAWSARGRRRYMGLTGGSFPGGFNGGGGFGGGGFSGGGGGFGGGGASGGW